jgi:hypothetical protein
MSLHEIRRHTGMRRSICDAPAFVPPECEILHLLVRMRHRDFAGAALSHVYVQASTTSFVES